MPLPPSSIFSRTVASVGFLPLFIFSRLNRPFNPGPIFFSVLSALWQTPHCWKTSFPFSASPFLSAPMAREHASEKPNPNTIHFDLRITFLVYNFPMRPAILLFAKAPLEGHAKTRLQESLGSEAALALHTAFVLDMLDKLLTLIDFADIALHTDIETDVWRRPQVTLSQQCAG